MGLGDALGVYQRALKPESVPALADAAARMAEAIEEHIINDAIKAGRASAEEYEYPDDANAREHTERTREKYKLDDFYSMPGTCRDDDGHVKPLPRPSLRQS